MKKITKNEVGVWGEEGGVLFYWVSLFRLYSAYGCCTVPDAAREAVSGARPGKVMWHDRCPRSLCILELQRWRWHWHWLVGGFWQQNLLSNLVHKWKRLHANSSLLMSLNLCQESFGRQSRFRNVKSRFRQCQSRVVFWQSRVVFNRVKAELPT